MHHRAFKKRAAQQPAERAVEPLVLFPGEVSSSPWFGWPRRPTGETSPPARAQRRGQSSLPHPNACSIGLRFLRKRRSSTRRFPSGGEEMPQKATQRERLRSTALGEQLLPFPPHSGRPASNHYRGLATRGSRFSGALPGPVGPRAPAPDTIRFYAAA
jgi:hypothetical protein